MSEYTPEPWTIVGKFSDRIYHEKSDTVVAQAWYPGAAHNLPSPADTMIANARRIVACVNACAGMPDPAAEIARLRADNDEIDEVCTKRQLEIYKLDAEIAKLRAERKELRELLWWVEAKLQPELNVSNYHHQQVCELNANATEAVLAIRAAMAEKGE